MRRQVVGLEIGEDGLGANGAEIVSLSDITNQSVWLIAALGQQTEQAHGDLP